MKGFMWACLMCLGVVVVLSPSVSAGDKVITGRALYRERIVLPPNAVFEAVVEDISLADLKAWEIARTRIVDPGNPPIDFAIVYDPESIKANRTYAVKGRILVEGRHEPNILLHSRDGRYSATVGCNRIAGSYVLDGSELRFSPGPTTLMACPPPLEELEKRLLEALANSASCDINGNTLELSDGNGDPTALFQAVDFL
jgi:uncharacterized lipoprotein YbaY